MAARCVPKTASAGCIQTGPSSYAGAATIRADDPLCVDQPARRLYAILHNSGHRSVPQKLDPALPGPLHQSLMESGAPNSNSPPLRERSGDLIATLHETNSAKRIAAQIVCGYTQSSQGRLSFRQQSLTAWLIDGRLGTICHDCVQSFLPGSNGRCQPSGTSPNHEYVSRINRCRHSCRLPRTQCRHCHTV